MTHPFLNPLIDPTYKSYAVTQKPMPLSQIGQQGWQLFQQDIPLPAAVLLKDALNHNSLWFKRYAEHRNLRFAPHGKTTMSPQLFLKQIADGAWGITVANSQQFYVCWKTGIRRILMANELIDPVAIDDIFSILTKDPELEFYCLVDSLVGCEILNAAVKKHQLSKPLSVLVEMGFKGGRCGCRSKEEAIDLVDFISKQPTLQFAGVECYEGIVPTETEDVYNIQSFLNSIVDFIKTCDSLGYFSNISNEIILTGGGSGYFDLVATQFQQLALSKASQIILRSGCYITHDSQYYHHLFQNLIRRESYPFSVEDQLKPALEIWSHVLSRPESNLAILSMGKRDASYDVALPTPIKCYYPAESRYVSSLPADWKILKLNDQHAFLQIPASAKLKVGDLVGCGISHPCTTFDKWKLLYIVDEKYGIVDAIETFF